MSFLDLYDSMNYFPEYDIIMNYLRLGIRSKYSWIIHMGICPCDIMSSKELAYICSNYRITNYFDIGKMSLDDYIEANEFSSECLDHNLSKYYRLGIFDGESTKEITECMKDRPLINPVCISPVIIRSKCYFDDVANYEIVIYTTPGNRNINTIYVFGRSGALKELEQVKDLLSVTVIKTGDSRDDEELEKIFNYLSSLKMIGWITLPRLHPGNNEKIYLHYISEASCRISPFHPIKGQEKDPGILRYITRIQCWPKWPGDIKIEFP